MLPCKEPSPPGDYEETTKEYRIAQGTECYRLYINVINLRILKQQVGWISVAHPPVNECLVDALRLSTLRSEYQQLLKLMTLGYTWLSKLDPTIPLICPLSTGLWNVRIYRPDTGLK